MAQKNGFRTLLSSSCTDGIYLFQLAKIQWVLTPIVLYIKTITSFIFYTFGHGEKEEDLGDDDIAIGPQFHS